MAAKNDVAPDAHETAQGGDQGDIQLCSMSDMCTGGLHVARRPGCTTWGTASRSLLIRSDHQRAISSRKKRTTVDVELTRDINPLGTAGTRVSIAPGFMRNHLYPKRLALYVIRGRTLQLDGKLGQAPVAATKPSLQAIIEGGQRSLDAAQVALERQRKQLSETAVLEQLTLLGPLRIPRRVTVGRTIHGSVSAKDIFAEISRKGIQLEKPKGTIQEPRQQQAGTGFNATNRIRQLGQYICKSARLSHAPSCKTHHVRASECLTSACIPGFKSVNVKLSMATKPIVVHVVADPSRSKRT